MFQDISQSLVLIAFVWGPLVNGGIQMGTHPTKGCCMGVGRAYLRSLRALPFINNRMMIFFKNIFSKHL